MANDYLVTGTRNPAGTIGLPENFQEQIEAPSSREAYITIQKRPGYEHVHVVAIKIKCCECNGYHMIVDPNLWKD